MNALFALVTGLGAFLLFFVQPMAAKELLPELGGTPATWGACVVFFQVVLLAGYAYAHLTTAWLSARAQAASHLSLVAVCAFAAARVGTAAPPSATAAVALSAASPLVAILLRLTRELGPACLLLSCTAPLVQRWAALLSLRNPYALYALSNVGALAALLSYPFVLEPQLTLAAQRTLFTRGFLLWAVGCAAAAGCVLRFATMPASAAAPMATSEAPSIWRRASWIVLAALPCTLLLAVTQHLTTDVAATPLFWVMPLAIYLLTYVLAFRAAGISGDARTLVLASFVLSSVLVGAGAFAQGSASLVLQLCASLGVLASGALYCHDALVRSRPSADRLTGFYLCIATGGALGSLLVSLIAPLVLGDFYELELCVLAIALVPFTQLGGSSRLHRNLAWLGVGVAMPILLGALLVRAGGGSREGKIVERTRTFLGPLRVTDLREGRVLTHGRIRHGMQLSAAGMRDQPTMYFGPGTALAQVIARHHAGVPRRIAIVGLGVGTIAAYGRAGDAFTFYELDPEVARLARTRFSFLSDTRARTRIVLGDGRLQLAAEPGQRFDLLALDAFSSDAVPVHLLTREAFAIYARQLAPDGVLLANVSNRHLEVERVVQASARANGLACVVIETAADVTRFVSKVRWAVMARAPAELHALLAGLPEFPARGSELLWTDARASVLPILH